MGHRGVQETRELLATWMRASLCDMTCSSWALKDKQVVRRKDNITSGFQNFGFLLLENYLNLFPQEHKPKTLFSTR